MSFRTGLSMANTPNSAIFEHREITGHRISSNQFNILKISSNKWDVRLLEALYIKKERLELNDSLPVELSLCNVLGLQILNTPTADRCLPPPYLYCWCLS